MSDVKKFWAVSIAFFFLLFTSVSLGLRGPVVYAIVPDEEWRAAILRGTEGAFGAGVGNRKGAKAKNLMGQKRISENARSNP